MADLPGPFKGILNGLGGLLNLFGGISKAVKRALGFIGAQLVTLTKGTITAFERTGGFFRDVADLFGHAFHWIAGPMVRQIHDWAVKLAKRLQKWFKPIIDEIIKRRKQVLDFWKHHIQPILDVVDIVRRVLRIAGKLHIPGATAIDKKIAAVETKVTSVFHDVVAKMNEVLGWINRIVTVDGILQEVILLTSIDHWKREILGIYAGGFIHPLTADQARDYSFVPPTTEWEVHQRDIRAYARDDESWMRVKGSALARDTAILLGYTLR